MSDTAEATLRGSLEDLPIFEDWADAADAVMLVRAAHPTKGLTQGFDITNDEHLEAQTHLNWAVATELNERKHLKRQIAEPTYAGLDVIGKLSVLYALTSFTARPTDADVQRIARADDALTLRRNTFVPNLRAVPAGAEGMLWQAGMIDGSLRAVDDLLKDGSEIKVQETHYWSELRTRYRRGHRQAFSRTIASVGVVDNKATAFSLKHPEYIPGGGIDFKVPSEITAIRVVSRTGTSTRDMGDSYPQGNTHLKVSRISLGNEVMDVPAIAVKRAKGEDVSRFILPPEGEYDDANQTDITIDGQLLGDIA